MRRTTACIALATAAALSLAAPAAAGGRPLDTELLGANEVGAAGDPDGSGTAAVTVNPGLGEICYTITVEDVAPIVAGHIHEAPAGSNGPVVVNLAPVFVDGTATGCVSVDRALAKEILKDSSDYYVNVHNQEYPGGALRGQL